MYVHVHACYIRRAVGASIWCSCKYMYNYTYDLRTCYVYLTGLLSMSVDSASTTSVIISWTLDDSVTATSYIISYSNTNPPCFTVSYDDITGIIETMYTLTVLQEATEYSITVTAILSDGETGEDSLTASTMAAG